MVACCDRTTWMRQDMEDVLDYVQAMLDYVQAMYALAHQSPSVLAVLGGVPEFIDLVHTSLEQQAKLRQVMMKDLINYQALEPTGEVAELMYAILRTSSLYTRILLDKVYNL